jgi:uncharacterized protein
VEHAALWIAVFLGGIVSGFAGFAFSAVAGAILLQCLDPMVAIPLMMACTVVSQATTLILLRRRLEWRETISMTVSGAVGLPIGLCLLAFAEPRIVRIGFGVFLAIYAVCMLMKPSFPVARPFAGLVTRCVVGFGGGVIGGVTAMPGALPVMWCELRAIPKEQQRAIVQPFILCMQVLGLALLAFSFHVHRELGTKILEVLPALAIGIAIGFFLYTKINEAGFHRLILLLLMLSGCLMAIAGRWG